MTLPEALISMVILTFIGGITGAIYLASLRMFKEGFTGLTAHDNAALAMADILPDVREAMDVVEPSTILQPTAPHVSDTLVYVLPREDSTGHFLVDPTSPEGPVFWGSLVRIYLGDEHGSPNPEGTTLWEVRSEIPVGAKTPPPFVYSAARKIADSITRTEFEHPVDIYSPTHYKLWDHVKMTIVGSATMWHETTEAEETAETAIRNHG